MDNSEILEEKTIELVIDNRAKSYLKEVGNWAMFLSILGFVGIGFMVLAGIFFGAIASHLPQRQEMPFNMAYFGLIYIVLAVIYFFPLYFLFQFSSKIRTALIMNNSLKLNQSLRFLKSHFKFIGIFSIVLIALYIVIFIVAITFGILMKA